MAIKMEIYAADQVEFIALQKQMESKLTSAQEDERIFEQLSAYPQADFSLQLRWPDDIDSLCQAMISEGLIVPPSTNGLLIKELWSDGASAHVYLLSQRLPLAFSQSTEGTIKGIATRWVKSYISDPDPNTIYYTTTYSAALKALSDLRSVSQHSIAHRKPLLFYFLC